MAKQGGFDGLGFLKFSVDKFQPAGFGLFFPSSPAAGWIPLLLVLLVLASTFLQPASWTPGCLRSLLSKGKIILSLTIIPEAGLGMVAMGSGIMGAASLFLRRKVFKFSIDFYSYLRFFKAFHSP